MTLEDIFVSVVIPVYNGERFLGQTLASALAQTYDPLEVVVVDDGSTDQSAILVEGAAARDNRIRFFRTRNSGVAAARNFGISQARGKLIAPLDGDDLWHPEKIARQVAAMQASPAAVGLVYCWSIKIDENNLVIQAGGAGARSTAQGRVTAELITGNFLETSSSPLIKRSFIEAVGGYDLGLRPHGAEDWKLYLALSEICEFAVIPEYLVGYRQWTGNLSRNVTGMAQSAELVARWLTGKWPDLAGQLRGQMTYNMNIYLSVMALNNRQLFDALRYRARAYRSKPGALLERSNFGFLARMVGFKPAMLRRRKPSVAFSELQPDSQVR